MVSASQLTHKLSDSHQDLHQQNGPTLISSFVETFPSTWEKRSGLSTLAIACVLYPPGLCINNHEQEEYQKGRSKVELTIRSTLFSFLSQP